MQIGLHVSERANKFCTLDNEIHRKTTFFIRLMLAFQLRLKVFFGTVCLIAQIRGEQVVVDVGELIRPLVSVHRLVLFLPDMYRQVDEQRRGVLSALPHLRQPVRPESERRTAIRQTVPKKTSVEVETSTLI